METPTIREQLAKFYEEREKTRPGYLYRFMQAKPEPDGCTVLTPLFVQDDFFRWSGIRLEVPDLLKWSNAVYVDKSVNKL